MGYHLAFEIQGLPKTINAINRAHWSIKTKEKNYWKQMVFLETRGKTPPFPLKKAKVIYTRSSSNPCDYDGLVSSFKHIQDALIYSLIIENDKLVNLVDPEYHWKKGKQRHGYIRVEIFEISEK